MTDVERLRMALATRYSIERELGVGGMATVYLAVDKKHDRPVALKVLKPEIGALIGVERFRREIEIAAKLNHPHILTLIDSGEVEGALFYVMPLVEGESLRERLNREKQLPIDEAIRFTRQIGAALSYAHRHVAVHRDIKPDNVLIHEGEAILTDFGIALAANDAGSERLTETGISLGTPHYMSPEQAAGDRRVDHRADIYALGALAYEMVVGRPPFTGDTAQSVLSQHVLKKPEPIDAYRSNVPFEFKQVVSRCLEKKPDDRWPTTEALVQKLDAVSGQKRLRSRPSRLVNRVATVAVGALLVISLGMFGRRLLVRNAVGPTAARVVVAVFENRTGDPSFDLTGERVGDWVTEGLQLAGTVDVIPWLTARRTWEFVQSDLAEGRVSDPLQAFADDLDANLVVSGAMYLDSDTLRIQPSIIDITTGDIVVSISAIEQPLHAMSQAISQVRERVMGAMSVTTDDRLAAGGNPPTQEAYNIFADGLDLYVGENRGAGDLLRKAFETDTTYLVPLIYASLAYRNEGQLGLADSVMVHLETRRSELSEYHRYWVDYLAARSAGDNERALVAVRQASMLATRSKAQYNRAYMAVFTNRPNEALEALTNLDPTRGPMRGNHNYWNRLAEAHMLLGNYEEMLRVTREGRAQYPDWWELEGGELRALALLGRVDEMYSILQRAPRASLSRGSGYRYQSAEILLMRHPELAPAYRDSVLSWMMASGPAPTDPADIRFLAISGWTDEAVASARNKYEEQGGWASIGLYGVVLAHAGESEKARDMATLLADGAWPNTRGRVLWWRAQIAAQLNELDEAVRLLNEAFSQGYGRQFFRLNYFLYQPLRNHLWFRELLQPRDLAK